ncbi:MarR family transcriptional regulator, partial [Sulfitobacter sp. 916]|uniref:MarR family transcriptional regulator n=1 Tax=Sulfitobacter sp. 916 TaxID=3368559 RepID=UPI0037459414
KPNLSRRTTMAAKRPARASLRYAKAPLSPRYRRELHQLLGHCSDRPPFPSKKELATRMGITPQTLRINIKALEDRGYVTREQRITSFGDYGSNTYRLDGLIRKLKELEPDFEKERQERKQAQKLTETPNARLRKNGGADGRTK